MTSDTVGTDFGAVGRLLDQLVASQILPGASVLILRDGQDAYYHAAGMADVETGDPVRRDTLFRIFSMTKPVTAAAIMVLADKGQLRLDDPVAKYVPEMAGLTVFTSSKGGAAPPVPARSATVKDLLTHTAGFSYWFQPGSPVAALYDSEVGAGRFERWRFDPALGGLDGLARSLARVPLVSQPGERWHYSMSLEVAGIVVERVSGERLDAFMTARLFAPLGMADTGFTVAPSQGHRLASLYGPKPEGGLDRLERGSESLLLAPVPGLSGGGGLVSTLDDYGRFAVMLRDGGVLNGRRILSEGAACDMMTNQLEVGQLAELPDLAAFGLGGTGEGLGFGLGGAVALRSPANGIPVTPGEYSWGGAASTTFWIDPRHRMVVVFMTQLLPPSADMLRDQLHVAVYDAMDLP
jgi:CubicO group peptidase (beta-lactamase class C family)